MEPVWAVLTDYERIADFVPGVQSSRVKDRSDDHLILEQELKAGFLLFTKRSRLKLRIEEDALRSIEFKDTSHKDFKFYAGSWAIEPLESGTQVVYRLDAKPDFSVPGPVVRVVLERKANELLAGIKGEIIHRASAIRLDGKLWLEGDSTVHSYSSVTTQLSMWIGAEPESGWQQALIGHRPIDFEVEIPVTSLKSGKDGLDSKMYEALDAGKHPTLLFRLRSYEVVAEAGVVSDGSGSENVVHILADGKLSIAGREKDLQLDIQIEFTEDGIRLRGSKTVNMSDFGAEPPTMMAGLLRTHDSVTIRFDVEIASVQEDDAEEDGKAAL
jgi:ribosome-associated toxin RatA of RatAB toxin-antitoxin module